MNREDFYSLTPGAMGTVYFFEKVKNEIDPKEAQDFIDQNSREITSTFDPGPGLSPAQYAALFSAKFLESRSKSREELERFSVVRKSTYVQICNDESYADMKKIESDPNFERWENPHFVNEILRAHENGQKASPGNGS